MELRRARTGDYPRLKALYYEAFPSEEQAPFWVMKRRADQGHGDFWNLMDGENWVGMTYVLRYKDLAYVFYLAIDAQQRGKGYGTAAMDALRRYYRGCRLFLALETLDRHAPNYEQRLNRHNFYARCSLIDLPHLIKESSVVFAIMGSGGEVRAQEYKELIDHTLGRRYRRQHDLRVLD